MENITKFKRLCAAICAIIMAVCATSCGDVDESDVSETSLSKDSAVETSADDVSSEDDTSQSEEATEVSLPDYVDSVWENDKYEAEAVSKEFSKGVTDFSIELFKQSAQKNESVVISPESALFALGMAANGAAGDTQSEMLKVLAGKTELEQFNKDSKALINNHKNNKECTVNIANSIWLNSDNSEGVKSQFVDFASENFEASAQAIPFDSSAADKINGWVSEKTDGQIEKIIDDVSSEARSYLLNAINFETNWSRQYFEDDIDSKGEFTDYSGKKQTCNMLNSTEENYLKDDKATGFIKSCSGGYSFVAILPNKGVSVEDYISNMTGDSFRSLYQNPLENYRAVVKMPEFTSDYNTDFSKSLTTMGMIDAFDSNKADFSALSDYPTYLGKIMHAAHIDVSRSGIKAAAATSVEMLVGSARDEYKYVEVDLNRPFIYAVVDDSNGIPLFIGCVNSL